MLHTTADPRQHGPLSIAGAQRLIDLTSQGHMSYDRLTVATDNPPHGRPWEQDPQGHELVVRGFDHFMHVVLGEMADQIGAPRIAADRTMSSVAASRHFILGIHGNGDATSGRQQAPWLHYQGKRADRYDANAPQTPDIFPNYLHFGTGKDLDGRCDSQLTSNLRLYVDTPPQYIPETTAQLCQAFLRLRGHLPYGKFREAATSQRDMDRHDGLIFFIANPEDLITLAALTAYVAQSRPHIVANRPGIVMGEPIVVNGVEHPAIRLAQSPGNGDSFNQGQHVFIAPALQETFVAGRRPSPERFIGALSRHAAQAGWNPQRPAFTAAQNTAVIDAALRAAGDDVRAWLHSDATKAT